MISVREIDKKDINICFEIDFNSINLWSKKQWENEFDKKGVKIIALSLSGKVIGVCAFQLVLDEAQINYLSVIKDYRRKGFGSYFMKQLIVRCKLLKVNKLLLEVSAMNSAAQKFYNYLGFSTVGIRKKHYRDGSDSILKEKILTK